ncbi:MULTISPECIES: hypothetical protein [Paraburkholderia]|uniref:Uncharacterized protein n=2 Tax=Paraburkholderia TaxID=1822464 RepID=A0ABW9DCU9_9BURK|nr:hypothetical protein [Paraburkholderia bryophila]NYH19713.1 putative membrane protein [Paraburkholderia bryophila]
MRCSRGACALFNLLHASVVERIVLFIGMGSMWLLVGCVEPLPPKAVVVETEQ